MSKPKMVPDEFVAGRLERESMARVHPAARFSDAVTRALDAAEAEARKEPARG